MIKRKASIVSNETTNIFIEPLSEMYLLGTTIDYVEEDISNGIFENKFVYKIDKNIASTCGCGI
jgi:Fe-S cluster assembly iron-binding protein IscA